MTRATADSVGVPSRPWIAPALIVGGALVALLVGLYLTGSGWQPPVDGLPDAGPLVVWGLPIMRLAELLLGVLTVAGLLYAAALGPQGRDGVVSREGREALVRAGAASAAWSVTSFLTAALTLANVLGISLTEALSPRIFLTYAWDLDASKAYLLTALMALLIAVGAMLTTSVTAAMGWLIVALVGVAFPGLTGHAAGLGDHALAITSGMAHQLAATLWLAGIVTLMGASRRASSQLPGTARRFSMMATWAVAVLAGSGLLSALTRIDSLSQLVTTWYGLLVLAKVLLMIAALALAWRARRRLLPQIGTSRSALLWLLTVEGTLIAFAIGIAVSLARTPPPRQAAIELSAGEQLIGYPFPPAPTVQSFVLGFHPNALFLTLGLVLAGLYIAGVMRLRARGDRWPVGRTAAWLLGVSAMIWATNAGIAAYSPVSFSLHMVQHMTLSMLAPIFLVLGGPLTLALRAIRPSPEGDRGPREWIVWALHSPFARFITFPLVVLLIYTVGLYGLYYTSLFGTLMSSHLGHVAMTAHFLLAGYLFYWLIIGIDPLPKPLPHWGKLVLLLVSMVIHSFFALPMMGASTPIAGDWFVQVQPPWLVDLLADTHTGGGIAWGFGEVPALVVLVVLAVQWARDDERTARRRDRQADRDGDKELAEYNARLARLAAADQAREQADRDR